MKKQKNAVKWEKNRNSDRYAVTDLVRGAVWESFSQLLLVFSANAFLKNVPNCALLDRAGIAQVVLTILFMTFFQEIFLRKFLWRFQDMKKRVAIGITVKLVIFAVFAFFTYRYVAGHLEELRQGMNALIHWHYEEYNRRFLTHLEIENYSAEYLPDFLRILLLSVYVLLFTLTWVGKRKWLIIAIPATAFGCLLYIGVVPSWMQIVSCFAGVFLVCQGKPRNRKEFHTAAFSAFIFLMSLLLVGYIFAKPANHFLTRAQNVKDFQDKLEKNVKTVVSKIGSTNKGAVSNTAPRYRDVKVLKIQMDHAPEGNLYLQDFYGTDYVDGEWTQSVSAFEAACAEHGIDPKVAASYLANSLYQCYAPEYYASVYRHLRGYEADDAIKNASTADYKIEYKGSFSKAMLLPYAADAANVNKISYRGDAVAQKPGTQGKTSFTAWNVKELDISCLMLGKDLLESAGDTQGMVPRSEEEQAFWDWYGDYVMKTCLSYPDYVNHLELLSYIKKLSTSEPVRLGTSGRNVYKDYAHAENVSFVLSGPGSTYSWDLDNLAPGEDAIEYFLTHDRKGFCVHFASAGVFLLRSLGVPARYACGYVVSPLAFQEQKDGTYVAEVIDRNAHAWTEVYLDGIGWVPFEMTPGYGTNVEELPTSQEAEKERREQAEAEAEEEEQAQAEAEAQAEASQSVPGEEAQSGSEDAQSGEVGTAASSQGDGGGETVQKKYVIGNGSGGGQTQLAQEGVEIVYVSPWKIVLMVMIGILLIAGIILGALAYRRAYLKKNGKVLKNWYYKWAVRRMRKDINKNLRKTRKPRNRRLPDWAFESALKKRYYQAAVRIMNYRIFNRLRRWRMLKGSTATDKDFENALLTYLGEEHKEDVTQYMRVAKAAAFSKDNVTKEDCHLVWQVYIWF